MNLNQVTIPSLDVKQAAEYYSKLGLKLIVDALPRYVRFECPNGDSTLSIHKVEALPKGIGISLYFEIEDLDNEVKKLKEKGIIFSSNPEDKPWLWREAHLYDFDKNHIILYNAGGNRKNPPWRVEE